MPPWLPWWRAMRCVHACSVEGPGGARYPPTHKLYFDEMQRLECEGVLLAVGSVEEKGTEKTVVILDQTVMHPQGGGQPTDTGTICCGGATFTVDMVRAVGGNLDSLIYHFGTFTTGDAAAFAVGAGASVSVDGPQRAWYARLHSAGHLLDDAMKLCGVQLVRACARAPSSRRAGRGVGRGGAGREGGGGGEERHAPSIDIG